MFRIILLPVFLLLMGMTLLLFPLVLGCSRIVLVPLLLVVGVLWLVKTVLEAGGDPRMGPGGRGRRMGRRNPPGARGGRRPPAPPPHVDRTIDSDRVCDNPKCRHANRPQARYCSRCGTRLTS